MANMMETMRFSPNLSLEMVALTKMCILVKVELEKLKNGKYDENMSFGQIWARKWLV